jgi:hypothetical protein
VILVAFRRACEPNVWPQQHPGIDWCVGLCPNCIEES